MENGVENGKKKMQRPRERKSLAFVENRKTMMIKLKKGAADRGDRQNPKKNIPSKGMRGPMLMPGSVENLNQEAIFWTAFIAVGLVVRPIRPHFVALLKMNIFECCLYTHQDHSQ